MKFLGNISASTARNDVNTTGISRWHELLQNSNDAACVTDIEFGTGDSRVLTYNYKRGIVN